jgi:hypothetical protein
VKAGKGVKAVRRTTIDQLRARLARGWYIHSLPGERSVFNRPLRVPEGVIEVSRLGHGQLTWWWWRVSPAALELARQVVERARAEALAEGAETGA